MIFKRYQVPLEDKNVRVWAGCGSEDVVFLLFGQSGLPSTPQKVVYLGLTVVAVLC